ncbi:MAG TPA: metallophosphoesterase [Spirochaetota bacterium]
MFFIFFIAVFIVFNTGIILFYRNLLPKGKRATLIMVSALVIVCLSFLFERIFPHLPEMPVVKWLTSLGSIYIGVMLYLFIGAIIGESIIITHGFLKHLSAGQRNLFRKKISYAMVLLTAVIVVGSHINTYFPTVAEYAVTVRKPCKIGSLKIVMVSDVHAGNLVGKNKIDRLAEEIMKCRPDMVIIAGDLFDRSISVVRHDAMMERLKKIRPKYGIWFALGNHDYFDNSDKAEEMAESLGITVLRDKTVLVANSFYLAGREDASVNRRHPVKRKDLSDILVGVDTKKPLIIIDHQPKAIDESIQNGADLVLSGHTHDGQFFPLNLFLKIFYRVPYGCKRIGDTDFIVSSGFGTWGPPIRNTGRTEITDIMITFKK